MENKKVKEEKVWSVTRVYKEKFSCEEAIRRLLEIHANIEGNNEWQDGVEDLNHTMQ